MTQRPTWFVWRSNSQIARQKARFGGLFYCWKLLDWQPISARIASKAARINGFQFVYAHLIRQWGMVNPPFRRAGLVPKRERWLEGDGHNFKQSPSSIAQSITAQPARQTGPFAQTSTPNAQHQTPNAPAKSASRPAPNLAARRSKSSRHQPSQRFDCPGTFVGCHCA